jgi:hypothetical protein
MDRFTYYVPKNGKTGTYKRLSVPESASTDPFPNASKWIMNALIAFYRLKRAQLAHHGFRFNQEYVHLISFKAGILFWKGIILYYN